MKKLSLILLSLTTTVILHAQQKPSQRKLADDLPLVQAKKKARLAMPVQQQSSIDTIPNAVILPQRNTNEKKPSERPMQMPARPRRQK
jgi:hypothetical protein